jgi:hypothetical protein
MVCFKILYHFSPVKTEENLIKPQSCHGWQVTDPDPYHRYSNLFVHYVRIE